MASGVVAGYGALSRRLATTVISGPLVFMLFGLAIGPLGLDLMSRARDPEVTRTLLESALVLLLFADAAAIRARDLRREEFLPVRLLVVGLPATMALGWLLAWPLLSGLSVWELALAGIVLAPTDAALGQQAIANDRVPALIRGGLSVESGLNDGLALPFFVLALAAAGEGHGHPGVGETFLRALLLRGAIGLAAGWGRGEPAALVDRPRVEQLRLAAVPGPRRSGHRVRTVRRGRGQRLHWRLDLRAGLRHPAAPGSGRPR
ncbi:cation:proton antiporter [Kitasatospora acidiphila]|uniref:cation:proton antiporter domain-containing protein n=1 Tax=Kitasatospora acidiphila TaxID=2567942 RepID=UPI003C7607BB